MVRLVMATLIALGLFAFTPGGKSFAQDKKETCEFGADDQRLKGNERKKFMAKCMANDDGAKKAKPKPKKKAEKKEG